MYILTEMINVVRIPPHLFHEKLNDAIENELNKKLANKVILNLGLCVALLDIMDINDCYILPGDGASHVRVAFRYIVFRPMIEEIIIGKIRNSSSEGIQVSLGFFDDIFIPPQGLQHPSVFNETEQAWVWQYNSNDGGTHDLFMDAGETIRLRITAEQFKECLPMGDTVDDQQTSKLNEEKTPYKLMGSINEPGLGLLTWWDN